MTINIDNVEYKVEIKKKITTKNTYIRVKKDLIISVTTNLFVSNNMVLKTIRNNISSIKKMIEKENKKQEYNNCFYYLGKKYDVCYQEINGIIFEDDKVYFSNEFNLNKWYMSEAKKVFVERLKCLSNTFSYSIPSSKLTIRKMKTRWGVCNTKDNRITLNLELIKKDIECIDYVIIHELSHYIERNHSKAFWDVVLENCPNYKNIRKKMKEY